MRGTAYAGDLPFAWSFTSTPVICPSIATEQANPQGAFTYTVGCPPTVPVTIRSRVYLKVFDPQGNTAATIKLGPFVSLDGKGFVAVPGEDTTFTSVDGVAVTAPAGAFDEATLVTVRLLPAGSLGMDVPEGMELGAYVDVDFEGTAKETLRIKVPVTTSAAIGTIVFGGVPIDLPWGKRLSLVELGKIVDLGGGQKGISTHAADQPGVEPQGRAALATNLPTNLIQQTLKELRSREALAFFQSAGGQLSAAVGQLLQGTTAYEILYMREAHAFVYAPPPTDWNGFFILPVPANRPYTIVRRDPASGWIIGEKSYQAITQVGGSLVAIATFEDLDFTPPLVIAAEPFDIVLFRAQPPVAPQTESCVTIRLELKACTLASKKVELRAVSNYALPDETRLLLHNLSDITRRGRGGHDRRGPLAREARPCGRAAR